MIGGLWELYKGLVLRLNGWVDRAFTTSVRWTRSEDVLLNRVQRLRTYLGLLILTWADLRYQPVHEFKFYAGLAESAVDSPFSAARLTFVVFIVFSIGFVLLLSAEERRRFWLRAKGPLTTMAAVTFTSIVILSSGLGLVQYGGTAGNPLGALGGVIFGSLLALAALPILWRIAKRGVATKFLAGELHPYLSPIIGVTVAFYGLGQALFREIGAHSSGYPLPVELTLGVGSPLVSLAMTAWEVDRLRRDHVPFKEPQPV